MCNMIKEEVRKKYQEAELVALGGFFFLRFVGPPITEPEYFGIIKSGEGIWYPFSLRHCNLISPTEGQGNSKKAERSVGGLLLKIANNAEYSEKGKYPHLAILNPFIKTQYARLTKFLVQISVSFLVQKYLHLDVFLTLVAEKWFQCECSPYSNSSQCNSSVPGLYLQQNPAEYLINL